MELASGTKDATTTGGSIDSLVPNTSCMSINQFYAPYHRSNQVSCKRTTALAAHQLLARLFPTWFCCLFSLTSQLSALFLCHLLVSPQLVWNLDGGNIKKHTRYHILQWKTKRGESKVAKLILLIMTGQEKYRK